jgi:eukaryotic-like serine/threonine-protein kinase
MRAMNCPRCESPLEQGARFCGVCGHRLDAAPAVPSGGANPLPAGTPKGPRPPSAAEPRARPASKPAPRPATPLPDGSSGPRAPTGPGKRAASSKQKLSEIALVPSGKEGDPYIGTVLNGRFTIERKLGEGGFGAVYAGSQMQTGRKVAVKLLHPEMTRDQNVVARFRREGQVLCSLRDAHTITTYDFDQTPDGTLFIAMELLEGRSLHDVFHDEAPIAWQRMLKIMREMCSSLEEAHGLGIVHRDLKPENINLENRSGNPEFVKILDFGIAKVMRGDGSSGIAGDMSPQLTATGQTLGTLEYMSPEQLMGKPLDGRSDIYGLGVVAFEMMTGRLPFPDAVGPAALISAQLKKTPPKASSIVPDEGIPPSVDALILKMLAKDKNQRFRDVNELRGAIEAILTASGHGRPSSQSEPFRPPSDAGGRPPDGSWASSPPQRAPQPPPRAHSPSQSPRFVEPREPRKSWTGPARPGASPGFGSAAAGHAGMEPTPAPVRPHPSPPVRAPRPDGHSDPPWAGSHPAGSSVTPSRPGANGGPAVAHRGGRPRAAMGTSSTPWMWITVAAVLFLAIVIGGLLALR